MSLKHGFVGSKPASEIDPWLSTNDVLDRSLAVHRSKLFDSFFHHQHLHNFIGLIGAKKLRVGRNVGIITPLVKFIHLLIFHVHLICDLFEIGTTGMGIVLLNRLLEDQPNQSSLEETLASIKPLRVCQLFVQIKKKLKENDGTQNLKWIGNIEEDPHVEQVQVANIACVHELIKDESQTLCETIVPIVPYVLSDTLNLGVDFL